MFSPHSIVWAARLWLSEKLRALADVIHDDMRYRVLPLKMVHTLDGVKVLWDGDGQAPGCTLLYNVEDYDKSWTPEGDYYELDREDQ